MQLSNQEQYVEFGIREENYAIKISDIQEIIKIQETTELPNCRHYVRGVINLRGRIIPVISLSSLFALSEDAATKFTRIIVVHYQEESVGIIVDRVNKVTKFADIQPPPDHIGGINGVYFAGIGMTDTGLVGILKLNEVLIGE